MIKRKRYTTAEAAQEAGISRGTLQRWISEGKLRVPKATLQNGVGVRYWSEKDLERLIKVKGRVYRKGRGRKRKS